MSTAPRDCDLGGCDVNQPPGRMALIKAATLLGTAPVSLTPRQVSGPVYFSSLAQASAP
jgi:hypothetical protein